MANGFLTALQETESSLAEWRMVMPEHDFTEWLTSLLSRWRMMLKWNSNFNLYTHMKKSIIKTICGVVAVISLVLVCGEAETMFRQILWSGSWMAVFAISAKGFEKCMSKEEKEERV